MEWKREEFSYKAYDHGFELKFRGRVVDRVGDTSSRGDKKKMARFARMAQTKLGLIFASDDPDLSPILKYAIYRVDAKWGICKQCGKSFARKGIGRPRKFCKSKCTNLWHTHKFRKKG